MDQNELLANIDDVFTKIKDILVSKSTDYAAGGSDFLANFRTCETIGVPVTTGILIRMLDKIKRVQSFAVKGKLSVANESAEDAVLDIIGYSIIIYCVLKETKVPKVDETARSELSLVIENLLTTYGVDLSILPYGNPMNDTEQLANAAVAIRKILNKKAG